MHNYHLSIQGLLWHDIGSVFNYPLIFLRLLWWGYATIGKGFICIGTSVSAPVIYLPSHWYNVPCCSHIESSFIVSSAHAPRCFYGPGYRANGILPVAETASETWWCTSGPAYFTHAQYSEMNVALTYTHVRSWHTGRCTFVYIFLYSDIWLAVLGDSNPAP